MAEPAKVQSILKDNATGFFRGKLMKVHEYKANDALKFHHQFQLPIPSDADEFYQPQTVVVTSPQRLGTVGQVCDVKFSISGYLTKGEGNDVFPRHFINAVI